MISLTMQSVPQSCASTTEINTVTIIPGWFKLRCHRSGQSHLFSWLFLTVPWNVWVRAKEQPCSHNHSTGEILVLRKLWLKFHTLCSTLQFKKLHPSLFWLPFRFQVRIIAGFNLLQTHILLAFREQPQRVQ